MTTGKTGGHLRCSIIGSEPKAFRFLSEWFRLQPHGLSVKGFVNHKWNGVTTLQFARLCRGLVHGALAPVHLLRVVPTGSVSKAEMLYQFAEVYGRRDISIEDVSVATVGDRTLSTTQPEIRSRSTSGVVETAMRRSCLEPLDIRRPLRNGT